MKGEDIHNSKSYADLIYSTKADRNNGYLLRKSDHYLILVIDVDILCSSFLWEDGNGLTIDLTTVSQPLVCSVLRQ